MIIVGRLTKDAVVNQLKDERKVVNFTVALNDYYKPKGQEKGVQTTTYVNCAYWIGTAVAEQLKKGALVELFGRPNVSAYTTMQGEARGALNLHVSGIKIHQFAKGELSEAEQSKSTKKKEKEEELIDDLPF